MHTKFGSLAFLFFILTFFSKGYSDREFHREPAPDPLPTPEAQKRCLSLAQENPVFAILKNYTTALPETFETEVGLVAWNPCQIIPECGSSVCKKRRGRDGFWVSLGGTLEGISRVDENGKEGISLTFTGGSDCPGRFNPRHLATRLILSCGPTLDTSIIKENTCDFVLRVTTPRACSSSLKLPVAPKPLLPISSPGLVPFVDFLESVNAKGKFRGPAESEFTWIVSLGKPLTQPEGCEGALVCQVGATGAINTGSVIGGVSPDGQTINIVGGKVGCGEKERMSTIHFHCPETSEMSREDEILQDLHSFQQHQQQKRQDNQETQLQQPQKPLTIPPLTSPTFTNATEYCLCKYNIILTFPASHPLCTPYALSLALPSSLSSPPTSFPTSLTTSSSSLPLSHPTDQPFIHIVPPSSLCSCFIIPPQRKQNVPRAPRLRPYPPKEGEAEGHQGGKHQGGRQQGGEGEREREREREKEREKMREREAAKRQDRDRDRAVAREDFERERERVRERKIREEGEGVRRGGREGK